MIVRPACKSYRKASSSLLQSCLRAANGHDSGSIDDRVWQRRPRHARKRRDRGPRDRDASYGCNPPSPVAPDDTQRRSLPEPRSSRRSERRPEAPTRSRSSASARRPVASRPSRAWSAHCLRSPASPSSSSSIWRRNTKAHCRRSSRVTRRCQSFRSPTACAWSQTTCT